MNEVVKYDNYMNGLKFTGFTSMDFNFLMMLCNKLRDKDTSEITISFEELRKKAGYTQHPTKQFISDLRRMNDKLMKITCSLETKNKIIMFVLFPTFEIDINEQLLTVSVNEKFKFILNEIVKNFTRFDLDEFVKLDSKYSKTLYRLLKQYRSTGHYEVSLEVFREKMDIPKSYTNRDVMSKVINTSLKELQNCFQNLICTAKYAHKRGQPVMGYIFTFDPEERVQRADKEQEPKSQKKAATKQKKSKTVNRFTNYEQRGYSSEDYKEMEEILLKKAEKKLEKSKK